MGTTRELEFAPCELQFLVVWSVRDPRNMKSLIKIFLALMTLVLLSTVVQAQAKDTLTASKKEPSKSAKGAMEVQKKETGNQPDSISGGKGRKMDRFVDEDGDGICDNRASGLGFRRQLGAKGGQGAMRKEMGDAPGRKQRRGGVR